MPPFRIVVGEVRQEKRSSPGSRYGPVGSRHRAAAHLKPGTPPLRAVDVELPRIGRPRCFRAPLRLAALGPACPSAQADQIPAWPRRLGLDGGPSSARSLSSG
jgi:hypothetical protein